MSALIQNGLATITQSMQDFLSSATTVAKTALQPQSWTWFRFQLVVLILCALTVPFLAGFSYMYASDVHNNAQTALDLNVPILPVTINDQATTAKSLALAATILSAVLAVSVTIGSARML